MGYRSRLNKSFEGALRLPLTECSRYVMISDCHRGTGTSNDNFLKNRNLYYAALQHYYQNGYTYIELGDGDELWENRNIRQIIEAHDRVFRLLSCFHQSGRLYMLYGNHDMIKKNRKYITKQCNTYQCPEGNCGRKECSCCPVPPGMRFFEGLILENASGEKIPDLYLTHGHQADALNSVFWRAACFLVRYFWEPLERFGVLDPTSAAKNYSVKKKTERRLQHWAKTSEHVLIAGHTHRPVLSEESRFYYNCGSCVHPYGITCLEIEQLEISLVKWSIATRPDRSLYVVREILAGPVELGR